LLTFLKIIIPGSQMPKKSARKKWIAAGASLVGAGLAAWGVTELLRKYQIEHSGQIQQLEEGSRVIETRRGPMEVAVVGEGPPVLVIHGGAGGYDQGLLETRVLDNFKFIAVSRPGYLRTPIETGRTPLEQADAFASLLDAMGIRQAAVIGTSMGGLVAIHFALHYPDRCRALVLVSSVNAPLPVRLSALKPLVPLAENDFIPWMLMRRDLLYLVQPDLKAQTAEDPEKTRILEALIKTAYPLSLRAAGMINDAEQIDNLEEIPLERISTPTLVIHGTADNVVPFEQGVHSAEKILGAVFLPIAGGSHYCILTHMEQTRPAILTFLEKHISLEDRLRWRLLNGKLQAALGGQPRS
jgi:pimeloyl-ACP methyl ester carboxylesterase